MHTVQGILERKSRQVVSISQDATVLDAARLMNQNHIGAVVVTRGDTVVGIFTERDILNRVVAVQADPGRTVVQSVMTAPVAVCNPQTSSGECRAVMKQRRIRHLPVVADDRLVGMISIGDILEDNEEEQDATIKYLYEYMLGRS